MSVWCPDDKLNCFSLDFKYIWYICNLCQDLGRDWISASCLIKYAHNDRSCDFGIFVIPEVNFSARAFKLGMLRDLKDTRDINSGLCQILICVFLELFAHFLINLAACPWLFGVRTIAQIIYLLDFKNFWYMYPFGQIFHEIEYQSIRLSIYPAFWSISMGDGGIFRT